MSSSDTVTEEAKLKKNDDVLVLSKSWQDYMAALLIDFFLIVLPILLFLTMDIGVGSFVLANSLVSRQARNISSKKLKTVVQSSSPLIILGFARLLSTTGVDYQVHVGEYGVHWNFFFTLATMSILTSIIDVPPKYCGILGSVILVGYQSCLMRGLNMYLFSEERGADPISQNKEGLFSVFGMCNLAYATMVLAVNLQANVLTGVVNLSMNTLFASPITALSILIAYALTFCVVIGLVDFYGIRLKFW
ncbi:Uncharacterized protein L484_001867 [Morus notabilis]|uniref:GPI-anchored wall transfer protein 1 n=1 Tax=Morus notabilis TaxID=981085 RepID=W9RA93_9ROSA|nr:Uncharacterized protein L484_001867 [Morus notabilis]